MYDYLVVGAGLFGAIFAAEACRAGRRVLVVERRAETGGNCRTEDVDGIAVHRYGAHIFHTDSEAVWTYVNRFARFNSFVNSPMARYGDRLYNLPFNMNTFYAMWGVRTPAEARAIIERQRSEAVSAEPANLEEQALSLVGRDIYETLIKGYTEKQWGRPCTELPAFIIKRLPVRFRFDNNYFNDRYQGIPEDGYSAMFDALLDGVEVRTGEDFLDRREYWQARARRIVYTGPIDRYYDYRFGPLAYRGLRFRTERLEEADFQGVAVVNYTEREVPHTRIIEHKHFVYGTQPFTVITHEYPEAWEPGAEPYYPVNDAVNDALYARYRALADAESTVLFGGRLADYRYYDMHHVVARALEAAARELSGSHGPSGLAGVLQ